MVDKKVKERESNRDYTKRTYDRTYVKNFEEHCDLNAFVPRTVDTEIQQPQDW